MDNALYLTSTLRQIEHRHRDEPLMQRAGAAAAAWAMELAGQRNQPILVLAGPGNNGGDAFEVANLLRQQFFEVITVFVGTPNNLPADAAAAYERFTLAGGVTQTTIPEQTHWRLIIDGLFGIGLSRAPDDAYASLISQANQLAEQNHCPLLALDCPSGLNADTGAVSGEPIRASHTITFISSKPGLHTADGPDCCGVIRLDKLELTPDANHLADGYLLDTAAFSSHLTPRTLNSHKGSFGSAGILGGASSMVGAAFLAGRAALKLGCGRVYIGLLGQTAPTLDPVQPELMLRRPRALLQTPLSALAIGPGLGLTLEASELLEAAIVLDQPLVLDADALNLIASEGNLQVALASRKNPALLTPHPAEAARLLDCCTADVQADRISAALEITRIYQCHVALKGCGTVIATVDGRWWINTNGNPGMATAGMGDVLTGLIAALMTQGWPPLPALLAGVHLHGAAADQLVAAGIGPIGMTAGEIIDPARKLFNEWVGKGKAY
jgi:hydroxyethylthiazole kinase-like uncharacterized protein yjeF